VVKARPSILWCYKKELFLSSHKKKRMNQIKKMMQRGLLDPEKDDPFSLFVASTNIRYCYYADTHKILGNTFGMCVLQVRVSYHRHPSHFWGLYSTSHSSRLLRDAQLQFV
jgi:N-acetyltransferase 10